jgi:hypothetical protein
MLSYYDWVYCCCRPSVNIKYIDFILSEEWRSLYFILSEEWQSLYFILSEEWRSLYFILNKKSRQLFLFESFLWLWEILTMSQLCREGQFLLVEVTRVTRDNHRLQVTDKLNLYL